MTMSKRKKLMFCDAFIIAFTFLSFISGAYVAYAPLIKWSIAIRYGRVMANILF